MVLKINLSGPDIAQADIDAVVAVLKTPTLSLGPKLTEFESLFARYVGRKHAIACNSGTSALHLCLLALGIGPGDEVITTPFSFIATSNTILIAGARPVFVDINPETYNIDIRQIEGKISAKTRAIMPVEVFGNPAGLDQVYELARRRGLRCIEDSCEALGSVVNGRKAGTLGDLSAFAFYPNKQMTTGEGGIILTDEDQAAALCASLRNQGRDAGAGWLAHARMGYNYRLSDINCALGITQLRRIEEFKAKRKQVAGYYERLLGGDRRLVTPQEPDGCDISWFVYVIRLRDDFTQQDRDQILEELRRQGIGCNNYFSPIHLQPFMAEQFGYKPGDFPVTERVSQRTIALPFCNNLTREQAELVCKTLQSALDKIKK